MLSPKFRSPFKSTINRLFFRNTAEGELYWNYVDHLSGCNCSRTNVFPMEISGNRGALRPDAGVFLSDVIGTADLEIYRRNLILALAESRDISPIFLDAINRLVSYIEATLYLREHVTGEEPDSSILHEAVYGITRKKHRSVPLNPNDEIIAERRLVFSAAGSRFDWVAAVPID